MKKVLTGLLCVIVAIIIAVSMTGCNGGSSELTFSQDAQQSSSQGASSDPSSSDTDSNPETVLYQLTTQQGETVQVLSTTEPVTEFSTVNYDPVSVPPMETTVYNSTTQYQAPTYSSSEGNQVTTKPTTTESTTEKKIKYISVEADGGYDGCFKVWADNDFGKKIESKNGSVILVYNSNEYSASATVLSELYAGEQVEIDITVPKSLQDLIGQDTEGNEYVVAIIPKGLIVSSDNVSNKEFRVQISL